MTQNKIKVLLISALLVLVVGCKQTQQPGSSPNNTTVGNASATPTPAPCIALANWVNNPQAPGEIPNNGKVLCDFHQFSWQTFLALMNVDGGTRVFQNAQHYPLYLGPGKNSCGLTGVKTSLFIRTRKDDNNDNDDFVLPEDVRQARSDAVIYDQNGNIVFYEVRFSRSECTQDPAQPQFTDPLTTELKVSYRVIMPTDKPNYVWINADINGDGRTEPGELLGMVGFHLAKSTPLHPEFVWATFEHKLNVPECQSAADPNTTWSFASKPCAAQLPNSINQQLCGFNSAPVPSPSPPPALTGTPTQICRVYHDATKTGDNQDQTNIYDIDSLNRQLVGPSGFITALPDNNPLAVLKNYMLVGALWENDITQPSSNVANQRGSIQLANSTMETTFQQTDQNGNSVPYTGTSANLQYGAVNCFGCHSYTPGSNVALSHIFTYIKAQQAK